METFGEWLRSNRESLNPPVSLREMARRMEMTPAYLSDIENDRRRPSEALCEKISTHYELDLEDVCANAGVLGEQAERYLRKNPEAVKVARLLARHNWSADDLFHIRCNIAAS